MGNTCVAPGGATLIIVFLIFVTQSSVGNQPRAGLLAMARMLSSSLSASSIAGWLYPRGIEAICMKQSSRVFPSTSQI